MKELKHPEDMNFAELEDILYPVSDRDGMSPKTLNYLLSRSTESKRSLLCTILDIPHPEYNPMYDKNSGEPLEFQTMRFHVAWAISERRLTAAQIEAIYAMERGEGNYV